MPLIAIMIQQDLAEWGRDSYASNAQSARSIALRSGVLQHAALHYRGCTDRQMKQAAQTPKFASVNVCVRGDLDCVDWRKSILKIPKLAVTPDTSIQEARFASKCAVVLKGCDAFVIVQEETKK